jgi:hypothetical protein
VAIDSLVRPGSSREEVTFAEVQRIERWTRILIARPLAWVLYTGWRVAIFIAAMVAAASKRLVRG